MSRYMNPAGKRILFYICLSIVLLIVFTAFLSVMAWRLICIEKKCIIPDRNTLALFEEYLDVKVPESTQQLSTCRVYDSGIYEWGTYLICKEDDIHKMYEPNEWDLIEKEIERRTDFPLEMSLRSVLYAESVTWWNPNPKNIEGLYVRNQNHRSIGQRTIKMFIEKEKDGWNRVFLLMRADSKYFPLPVLKLFEEEGERDILIGERYREIEETNKKDKMICDVFSPCDSKMMVECVDRNFFLSFPKDILSSEAAITKEMYNKPSFVMRVKIKSSDLDDFMKSIADTETKRDEYFIPYNRSQDTRSKVWNVKTPAWYNETIKEGWIFTKETMSMGNTMNLHNLYIDTSDPRESVIYINGRVQEDILQKYSSDTNNIDELHVPIITSETK